jgi:DNA repair protein RecN (Recombination protein N)
VSGDEELIALRESFKEKLDSILSVDDTILKLEEDLKQIFELLLQKATILHERRSKNALIFASEIENSLKQLGISHPKIIFDIQALENPNEDGFDEIHTLFSSNKDQKARRVEEVASGGEKSRLMLAIKSIIGSKRKINSMVFDEIDTGISGEVALKTGELLSEIGKNNQVISITHLPQVASKGIHHFKVSKNMVEKRTNVQMMKLSDENRIEELAEMLGGKNISESARKTAQELLK